MIFRLVLFLVLIVSVLPYRYSHGCSLAPITSFVEFTDDMNHVFVMLRGGTEGLAKKYESSGLYRMDGSRDPVWTVEWFSQHVLPHSDGKHLVQIDNKTAMLRATGKRTEPSYLVRGQLYEDSRPKIGSLTGTPHAISFYAEGELLHEYRIGDLFDDISNTQYRHCFGNAWFKDFVFDENNNVFKLATTEDKSYTFSVLSGEITKVEKYKVSNYKKSKKLAQRNKLDKRRGELSERTTKALLDMVYSDMTIVENLGQPYLNDYSLAEQILAVHGQSYYYFDKKLKTKRNLSLLAVSSGKAISIGSLRAHQNDTEILLAAVKHDGKNYPALPDKLKDNKGLLLSALQSGGMTVYNGAPARLRNDREVLVEALRAQLRLMRTGYDSKFYIKDLGYIPEHYLIDEQIKYMIDAILGVHSANYAPDMAGIHKEEAYSLIRNKTAKR